MAQMPTKKHKLNKHLVRLLAISTAFVLAGCVANTAAPPPDESPDVGFSSEYRIGVGDSLSINVWRNPDLSVTVPVRPDGKVSVPLAGDIEVGNRTPEEVGAAITKVIGKFIRDPYVTVIVTDMGSDQYRSRVRVTGAVNSPLSAPYRQGMTVLDVVLEAGGLTEFANPSRASLYRKNEKIAIDLRGILNRGDMSTNYALIPGDVITVPERAF
jgi:polysaccharide export outer membrane protein